MSFEATLAKYAEYALASYRLRDDPTVPVIEHHTMREAVDEAGLVAAASLLDQQDQTRPRQIVALLERLVKGGVPEGDAAMYAARVACYREMTGLTSKASLLGPEPDEESMFYDVYKTLRRELSDRENRSPEQWTPVERALMPEARPALEMLVIGEGLGL